MRSTSPDCSTSTGRLLGVSLPSLLAVGFVTVVFGAAPAQAQDNPLVSFHLATSSRDGYAGAPAAADFDKDGHLDVVVVNDSGDSVRILYGDGAGNFSRQMETAITPSAGAKIAVADVTGDGAMDTLLLSTYRLTILSGDGSGGVAGETLVPLADPAYGLAASDVNRDGRADVLLVGATTVSLMLASETGLQPPVIVAAPGSLDCTGRPAWVPADVCVAFNDVTGDGFTDIVAVPSGTTQIVVFAGDGAGMFSSAISSHGQGTFRAMALGDMNHDGRLDLVGAFTQDVDFDYLTVQLGNGDGTFAAPLASIRIPYSARAALHLADHNGDGRLDVAFVHGPVARMQVYTGSGGSTLTGPTEAVISDGRPPVYNNIIPGDLNKDGLADLFVIEAAVWGKSCDWWNGCTSYLAAPGGHSVHIAGPTVAVLAEKIELLEAQLAQFQTGAPLETQVIDLTQRLVDANRTIEGLRYEIDLANATVAQREATIASLQSNLAAKDATIATLHADLAAKDATIAGLRSDLNTTIATLTSVQAALTAAHGKIDSLIVHVFGMPPDANVATVARDKARERIDRAIASGGPLNLSVVYAEKDYKAGLSYLAAGSYSSAVTSFRSAFTRVNGIR